MKNLLESYMDTHVQFAQTDEITMSGVLINVQSDYASIITDEGKLIHYPYSHLKSVTTDITELPKGIPVPNVTFPETFIELLSSMIKPQNLMIRVENGKDSKIGVLSRITDEYISMVINMKEMVHFSKDQIKNVSPIYLGTYTNTDKSNQATNASNQNTTTQNHSTDKSNSDKEDKEQEPSYDMSDSGDQTSNSESNFEKNKSYIIIEPDDESKSIFEQNKQHVVYEEAFQNLFTKPLIASKLIPNRVTGKQKYKNLLLMATSRGRKKVSI